MAFGRLTKVRLGAALLVGGLLASTGLATGAVAQVSAYREDPGAALTRHLRTLSDSPRNVHALMGAGKAALQLGDAQAALTFFARAEEVSPRDGAVKAGMGSAFLQMEKPAEALRFFGEAVSLGMPVQSFAGDRGLAYDLAGDPRRAQADYRMVLAQSANPEVSRRLALSLAISGDQAGALAAIDDQLRRKDRAAWRTRAFVLALTGDAAGATQAAQAVMPQQAAAMAPFFSQLPGLTPSQRAYAVHFGHFPSGAPIRVAANTQPPRYAAPAQSLQPVTQAGRPDAGQSALGSRTASVAKPNSATSAPRRAPAEPRVGSLIRRPAETAAPAQPRRTTSVEADRVSGALQPMEGGAPAAARSSSGMATETLPPSAAASDAPVQTASAGSRQSISIPRITEQAPAQPMPFGRPTEGRPPSADSASSSARLADIAAALEALSDRREAAAKPKPPAVKPVKLASAEKKVAPADAKAAADKKTTTEKKVAEKKAAEKKLEADKPKEPSRIWVQIAGGANKAALPREYARLKGKAPKLLAGKSAWTAPLKATNRLLVGPFKTEKEAQAFVNELNKLDFTAFAWTSPAGQAIEKLALK